LALGNAADAVEIVSAGYILRTFKHEDGSSLNSTQKELLTAAVFVGMLVGGILAGSAADRLGRRNCLLVSLAINCTFASISAAAPSVGWLIAARVCAGLGKLRRRKVHRIGSTCAPGLLATVDHSASIVVARSCSAWKTGPVWNSFSALLLNEFLFDRRGFWCLFEERQPPGVGGSIPVVFTLGAELFTSRIRGAMVSLIASFWMVGSAFAAIVAWVVLGDGFGGRRIVPGGTWRHYALVAALPAVAALLLTFIFVPESPRFLARQGRYDEMRAVLQRLTNAPVHLPSGLVQHRPTRRPGPSFASAWQSWRRSLGGGLYQSASGIAPDQI
ncbi:unnamed protein product, partial [Ectocarpus sp. 8 AP-2014]